MLLITRCTDPHLRVKAPWLFQNQYNDIYWAVWNRLMSCVGDLDDVCLGCANGASPADDISRFMAVTLRMSNGYVPGQVASNRWKFPDEETPVMNENIISLFDQLCYVVVFGNVSTMMERIPQAEREVFFNGVRKFAHKMRKTGEYCKRFIERNAVGLNALENVKSTAPCSALFQDSEVWIHLLQQSCFASGSSP
jgi:hypothetical protein